MQSYVVIAAKPGRRVAPERIAAVRAAVGEALTFVPEVAQEWTNPSGTVAVLAWEAHTDVLNIGSHWHAGPHGLATFSGRPTPHGSAWRLGVPWAQQLHERWPDGPLPAGQPLDGIYTCTRLDADGAGTISNDPFGIGMLYRAEDDDVVAVSCRAALAAWAVTPTGASPARDPFGVGWLVALGSMIGDRTGFADVRVIPVGSDVRVDPGRGVVVRPGEPDPWWRRDRTGSSDLAEQVDVVHRDLSDRVVGFSRLPVAHPFADLTGGFDSRLVLSLALEAGVADRFSFRTTGPEGAPDVLVAQALAAKTGISHEHSGPRAAGSAAPSPSAGEVNAQALQQLLVHVFQTSGAMSAWDLIGGLGAARRPTMTGLQAELLRSHYAAAPHLEGESDVRRYLARNAPVDGAGLLRVEARRHYVAEVEEEVHHRSDMGTGTPLDRLDVYFMRHRLRRWSGVHEEIGHQIRLYPLYSVVGTQLAQELPPDDRRDGRLHLEVMRRTGTGLEREPFAGRGWAPRLADEVPDLGPLPPPVTAAPGVQPRWQVSRFDQQRHMLRELLLDDASNPVFDVLDRRAVEAALAGEEIRGGVVPQLYGATAAVIWCGGHELAVGMGTPPEEVPSVWLSALPHRSVTCLPPPSGPRSAEVDSPVGATAVAARQIARDLARRLSTPVATRLRRTARQLRRRPG